MTPPVDHGHTGRKDAARVMRRLRFIVVLAGLLAGGFACGAGAAEGVPGRPALGAAATYRVGAGEMLHDIARRFALGFVELRAANPGVDAWLPPAGTVLQLPGAHVPPDAPPVGIVVNLAELRLYYFAEPGARPLSFPIGIGREGRETPLGVTKVAAKRRHPVWTVPASVRADAPWLPRRVPPGPANPLGAYALDLALPGYVIHGTNRPDGIGRRVSYGCIRLYPEHIESLFRLVAVGTPVRILDQRAKIAWSEGELFLEVHPTQEEADLIEEGTWPRALPSDAGDIIFRVRRAAGDQVHRLDLGRALATIKERRGIPVRLTRAAPPSAGAAFPGPFDPRQGLSRRPGL